MKGQQRLLYLLPACILVFAFFLFPLAYLSYISFFEWDGYEPLTYSIAKSLIIGNSKVFANT